MNALLEVTAAKTRTEAVNRAINDFIRRETMTKVLALAGSVDDFMTQDDLMHARKTDSCS